MSSISPTDLVRTKRRLRQELRNITNDPPEGCSASLIELSNLFSWEASIKGPASTPYESGTFNLTLQFPENYPFAPPTVIFTNKIYHPNIDHENGYISLNILHADWCPVLTVSSMLWSLRSFLGSPDTDNPYYPEISKEYVERKQLYDDTARKWTEEFAKREY